MYTIVCTTNRSKSISLKVSQLYSRILQDLNVESLILDLIDLPSDFIVSALYDNAGKNQRFNELQAQVEAAEKLVFIVPEYNGSFPGVFKAFIDGMDYPNPLKGKKAALVGLSSGIQGAGLALSHLTDIFNYCGMHVLALKPKLAKIEENMDKDFQISNSLYVDLLREQAQDLIQF